MERSENNTTVAPLSEWSTSDLMSVWRMLGAAVRQSVRDTSAAGDDSDERDLRADAEMFAVELIRRGAI